MSIRYVWISIVFMTIPISATARHPNVVLILADDFGVGDIQAHYPDNKIATPHLDRLVQQSISFTDAHSPSAVCSPTRYGLLTGRYAWRTRLQEWVIAAYEPPLIEAGRLTLPEFLRQQGYTTACIGKWHLGWNWPGDSASQMTTQRNGQWQQQWDFTKPIRGGPIDRGFDYFFGSLKPGDVTCPIGDEMLDLGGKQSVAHGSGLRDVGADWFFAKDVLP